MKNNDKLLQPLIPASQSLPELTFKVILFSILLAVILAASNAYLALKIGMTISATIPASVMALGILRFFKNSNVLESNMIQTSASAGEGIASAVSFVLPAMIILQIWNGFPYWECVILTSLGGILGVLFSIPLRRILLDIPILRFPEGTAVGNLLKASTKGGKDLKMLVQGASLGAIIAFAETGLKVIGDNVQVWWEAGRAIMGFGIGFGPAPIAAGYILGIETAISLFVGVIVGWAILLPILSVYYLTGHTGSLYADAMGVWSAHLRYVGVGLMFVGGIWTLFRLLKPIVDGLKTSLSLMRERVAAGNDFPRTERDFPINWTLALVILGGVLIFSLIFSWMLNAHFNVSHLYLVIAALCTTIFALIVGFLLAAICGYFAGLLGTTYNPMSGMAIICLILVGLLYGVLFMPSITMGKQQLIAGLMILVTTVVACIAQISNENIQDLKAGQMVGATPWKQQLILCLGVVVSALVIAPVLHMLYNAYGMGGAFPRPGMDPTQMLAAPQANLMATLAKGLSFPGQNNGIAWNMMGLGAVLAVLIIICDQFLQKRKITLSVLGVGLGVYLPPEIILPIFIGAFVNYLVKRRFKKASPGKIKTSEEEHHEQQHGILFACGIVAGSALMGVLLAIPFVFLGSADALSIMPAKLTNIASYLGVLVFLALCYWLYRVNFKKR